MYESDWFIYKGGWYVATVERRWT